MKIEALYEIYLRFPSVNTDTRTIKPGDIFFALKGPNFNANAFASEALVAGAAYVIVDELHQPANERIILVNDVLESLQQLAKHHRKQFHIPFLAITGSNGKTTTKELCHTVLSQKYNTHTTRGNLNNHIGIPLTLLEMQHNAEIAVIEMGANHQGEIRDYCHIALPGAGLITNIGRAHLEGFGGIEGVKKGKGELFDFLSKNAHSTIFICSDFAELEELSIKFNSKQLVRYGTGSGNFVSAVIKRTDPYLELELTQTGGDTISIQTRLVGSYNQYNVLAAAAVGLHYGISLQQIKNAVETYNPQNNRSQWKAVDGNVYILDAYNANPSSMQAAIENFAAMQAKQKILFLGAMKEMGDFSSHEHQQLVKLIRNYSWKTVVLVGEEYKGISHPFLWFSNSEEAGKWWIENAGKDNTVLVKGSRGSAMEKMIPQN